MGLRSFFRRRRNRYVGAAAAVILVVGAGAGLYVGKDDHVPYSAGARVMMQFLASRDMGRLPSRSGWCTAVRSAEHCWLLQESSGDAVDTGVAATKWDLTPGAGSPRQGVVTGLPVTDGGSVETATEAAHFADGVVNSGLVSAVTRSYTTSADPKISLTFVVNIQSATGSRLFAHLGAGSAKIEMYWVSGWLYILLHDGTTQSSGHDDKVIGDSARAWRCVTAVYDGEALTTTFFVDGALAKTVAVVATDAVAVTGKPAIGTIASGVQPISGGVARFRFDQGVAFNLAQHQQLCGSLWQPPSRDTNTRTKVAAADTSWTQTGGVRCYASSATTALCAPGGSPTYAWTAALAGIGWPIEPDRTNRVLQSVDLSDAAWGGSATQSAVVAPDGSLTAWQAAYTDAVTTTQVVTGYGVTANLYPRLWVKCSSGTFKLNTTVGTGQWDVNCTTVAGAWTDIHSTATAVTVNTAMASDGAGAFTWALASDGSGATVDVWMPTVTEVNGLSVIPTAGAAVATGEIAWEVDNSSATYYNMTRGRIVYHADWTFEATIGFTTIHMGPATAGKWQVWANPTASRMRMYDSAGVTLGWCVPGTNPVDPPGVYDWEMRYDSAAKIPGIDYYATTISNGAEDACPEYASTWTPANPGVVYLDGLNPHTSVIREFRTEDRP